LGQLNYLADLDLSNNQLTGQIPSQLADLPRLGFLTLNDNQLTGCIPRNAQYWIRDDGLLSLKECD